MRRLGLLLLLSLSACDYGQDDLIRRKAQVDAVRDSLANLNALEDRVFTLVDLDGETGRLRLAGSVEEFQVVKQEAYETTLEGCPRKARDELVLAMDHMIRAQTDSAAAGESWKHVEAYREAADACENWLEAQAPR